MTSVISTPGPMQETFLGKNNVCHILTHLALRLIFLLCRIGLYCPADTMLNFRRHSCSISGGARAQFPADFAAQPHNARIYESPRKMLLPESFVFTGNYFICWKQTGNFPPVDFVNCVF